MKQRDINKYKLIRILRGSITKEEFDEFDCKKCKSFLDKCVAHMEFINIKDSNQELFCFDFEKK